MTRKNDGRLKSLKSREMVAIALSDQNAAIGIARSVVIATSPDVGVVVAIALNAVAKRTDTAIRKGIKIESA